MGEWGEGGCSIFKGVIAPMSFGRTGFKGGVRMAKSSTGDSEELLVRSIYSTVRSPIRIYGDGDERGSDSELFAIASLGSLFGE